MKTKKRRLAVGLLYLLYLDLLLAILLFTIKPMTVRDGLPSRMILEGHPYKSYILTPSVFDSDKPPYNVWHKGDPEWLVNISGRTYDYGLFEKPVYFDAFSHGVFHEDLNLYARPKESDEVRIFFIGGSTTYQPWPFLVAEKLSRSSGKNVKAISGGTGGYTSQENLVDLMLTGFEYLPDLVVAYLPANDVYHAARWPNFKRDYSHFRAPFRTIERSTATARPIESFLPYPFGIRLLQILLFNRQMKIYRESARLDAVTTQVPHPDNLGIVIDEESFQGTLRALEDNIFNMQILCESRNIPFLLVTQKLFKVDSPVTTQLDGKIHQAISHIHASPRLSKIEILDLQTRIPEKWNGESLELAQASFPTKMLDREEPLFYDSMHFSPSALYLVAAHVAKKIEQLNENTETQWRSQFVPP